MNPDKVTIYTDGACDPNPGPGGWAALLIFPGHEQELGGGDRHTTNNRMELTAAVRALEALPEAMEVTLYTDSQYLKRGMTEWLPGWLARNWRSTSGKVANQDLWQALLAAAARHKVNWRWLRGHAGSARNERVDRLARSRIPLRALTLRPD
ncbi:MAG TPA: ribonuclease HI [Anaerolineaceae bacterium]